MPADVGSHLGQGHQLLQRPHPGLQHVVAGVAAPSVVAHVKRPVLEHDRGLGTRELVPEPVVDGTASDRIDHELLHVETE